MRKMTLQLPEIVHESRRPTLDTDDPVEYLFM